MKAALLKWLRCPSTGQKLHLETTNSEDSIDTGWLISEDNQHRYPIINGIPRFVPETNYADNFGMQWNMFSKTQLDSYSKHAISAKRFWSATGWAAEQLAGAWVLDIGCGAGRFAEIALNAGANVIAIDYSSAADACYTNLKIHANLHVIQCDIYALPLRTMSFDFVYSLGVLQHTPNVACAFKMLPVMLKKNGHLCVDYYERSWKSFFTMKYWLRPVAKRIKKAMLFSVLSKTVPFMLSLSRLLNGVPIFGHYLKHVIPVANYYGILPLSHIQHKEWSLLDTFDWLSPAYDNPQREKNVRQWMIETGIKDIQIIRENHLVARGKK